MADDSTPEARPIVTRAKAKAAGAKRYFNGKPCPAAHVADRLVVNGACVTCQTHAMQARRAARTLAAGPGVKQYFSERPCKRGHVGARLVSGGSCVACDTERWAAKRALDPQAVAATMAKYYLANGKQIRARTSAWAVANPLQLRTTRLAYRTENPEQIRAHKAKRRARILKADGHHTGEEIRNLFILQGGRCVYCRTSLRDGYHADHITPLSKGGSNWIRNVQLTCQPCNNKKWAHDPIDFAQANGFLL